MLCEVDSNAAATKLAHQQEALGVRIGDHSQHHTIILIQDLAAGARLARHHDWLCMAQQACVSCQHSHFQFKHALVLTV